MLALSLLLLFNVQYTACDTNQLIFTQEEKNYSIDFFNVLFYDEQSHLKACEYLKNSDVIELEEEPLVENAYYIYTDGKLFQSVIIEKGWARVNMEFKGYLHSLKSEEVIVLANYEKVNRNNLSLWILSGLLILFCLCLFLAIWL